MKLVNIIASIFMIIYVNAESQTFRGLNHFDSRSPMQMAQDLPDSTIVGYEFVTKEQEDGRMYYRAFNSKYDFLDKLAKADRLIRNFDYIEKLFTWVNCACDEPSCFYEMFMIKIVDNNPYVTRNDYKYIKSVPIYYTDFKKSYLQYLFQ